MINEMDASCHYGDHYWMGNGRCSNCYAFNGGLLEYNRMEKAEREGRLTLHEDHAHYTLAAAAACKHPGTPEPQP